MLDVTLEGSGSCWGKLGHERGEGCRNMSLEEGQQERDNQLGQSRERAQSRV